MCAHTSHHSFWLLVDYSGYRHVIYTQLLHSSLLSSIPVCSENGSWGVCLIVLLGVLFNDLLLADTDLYTFLLVSLWKIPL